MSTLTHDFDEFLDRRGTDAVKFTDPPCPPDVLPLWVADTDFKCPQPLIDHLTARAALGHYGYPADSPGFKPAVAEWMKKRFGWQAEPEWVEFALSAMLPLLYAINVFSAPGDGVVIQTPVYPPFWSMIGGAGRRIVSNPLLPPGQGGRARYEIDFADLEQKLADPGTRLMILCNPHNPTGRSFSRDELLRVGKLCAQYGVYLMADEIHSDIVYTGGRHIPFGSLDAPFAHKALIAINPSKTFNTAGLRGAAFICPDKNVRDALVCEQIRSKSYGRPIFGADSVEVLYNHCEYYADQLVPYLHATMRLVAERLRGYEDMINFIPPEATYLLWLDCRGLGLSQPELRDFFLEDAKLLLNDGETFGPEGVGFMRMNIASPRATINEAMNRLTAALDKRR